MDDTEKSLLDYLDILRRRKLYIIVAFPLLTCPQRNNHVLTAAYLSVGRCCPD